MIALDTNVLARLVVNDDKVQAKEAANLIDSGVALFVPLTVMLELEWVLRGAYRLDVAAVLRTFEHLLSIRNISFERQANIEQALKHYAQGFDFADALHHSATVDCTGLASFDKKFEKLAVKLKLKPSVRSPNSFTKV
ncbi:MAG: type II toxin-antitoxin system VapC family toxin [Methylococcaceae bacterium]|nr:type II toxin-antitoxin system VapC family toxin [Methylococcaceae bacterium]